MVIDFESLPMLECYRTDLTWYLLKNWLYCKNPVGGPSIRRWPNGHTDPWRKAIYHKGIGRKPSISTGSVLFFGDEAEAVTADDGNLKTDTLRLLKDLDRLSETPRNYNALARLDIEILSFIIPGLEGFTPQERQPFLETTSPRRRLRKCKAALNSVVRRIQLSAEIK